MTEHPARKLAVILHADVVGSTSLVRLNETRAHERIRDAFSRLSETIESHGGIAHEIRGDALVAEFSKASDAVSAAVVFQAANATWNEQLTDDVRPIVRIGIAMGEIVVADRTLTGEGVVLAQRLEQLAAKGGACIQGAAYETIPRRLPFDYETLGEQQVKGFDEPVKVYAVSLKPGSVIPEPGLEARHDSTALPLPRKPSIAILPFANMSGDQEQEYFSDGITDDLTTALSRFDWLFVIARNSAFTYKGKIVDARQVSRELGVRYVLEGSVRRAGGRIRINAQLIDAEADRHVWAERFDRQMDDVFELQDDIVTRIAATVGPELTLAEIDRVRTKRPNTLDAWDKYLRALAAYHKASEIDNAVAIAFLEGAIDLESEFANAYALLALCYTQIAQRGWVQPVREAYEKARELAENAVRLAPTSPEANQALAFVLSVTGEPEKAVIAAQRAISLNPNFTEAHVVLAQALNFSGDPKGGLAACRRAARGNPRDIRGSYLYDHMGHAYFFLGDYEQAIAVSKMGLHQDPSLYGALVTLAGSYAQLGREDEARRYVDELLRLIPRYSLRALRKNPMFVHPDLIDKLVESMRLAGLPED